MLVFGTYHYGKNAKLVINNHTEKSEVDKIVAKHPELENLVYDNSREKSADISKDSAKSGQSKRTRKRSN